MDVNEYKSLIDKVKEASIAYYTKDHPIITDEEYDNYMKLIKEFENQHPDLINISSPTQKVGDDISSKFKPYAHKERMWSMEDVFSIEELTKWLDKFNKDTIFIMMPKYDGCSLNLIYSNGKLLKGVTRGNGIVGEDVTFNIKYIKNIPLTIDYPGDIEIRGEVVISKERFDVINQNRTLNNKPILSNPRNAASGGLRNLDKKEVIERNLEFIPWGIGYNTLELDTYSKAYDYLKSLFSTKDDLIIVSRDEVTTKIDTFKTNRELSTFMLDGVVIRTNDTSLAESLGYTAKFPKFMVAYKFEALEKSTILKEVINQVGRSGVITPVGIIEPVVIDGVTVNRVTLNNYVLIEKMNLGINSKVGIIRSGDVIPKLTSVFTTGEKIIPPTNCPECNTKLDNVNGIIFCNNYYCSSRVINRILHFTSRESMDIDGVAEATLRYLYHNHKLKDLIDLYKLTKDDLIELGDKISDTILANIKSTIGTRYLSNFITSLGIPGVGRSIAKLLVSNFSTNWYKADVYDISKIKGIGAILASNIVDYIKTHQHQIESLLELLQPILDPTLDTSSIHIVITGKLSIPREDLIEYFSTLGVTTHDTVTKQINYLVIGENASNTSKYIKATQLNIPIVTEEQFMAILQDKDKT